MHQRTEDLGKAQTKLDLLATVVNISQNSGSLEQALEEIASVYSNIFSTDVCILQLVQDNSLTAVQGVSSTVGTVDNCLGNDPLATEAITSGEVQAVMNVSGDTKLSDVPYYKTSGIKAHLVIPISHRQVLMALMSLQWQQPGKLHPEYLSTINISAQLLALVLNSLQ